MPLHSSILLVPFAYSWTISLSLSSIWLWLIRHKFFFGPLARSRFLVPHLGFLNSWCLSPNNCRYAWIWCRPAWEECMINLGLIGANISGKICEACDAAQNSAWGCRWSMALGCLTGCSCNHSGSCTYFSVVLGSFSGGRARTESLWVNSSKIFQVLCILIQNIERQCWNTQTCAIWLEVHTWKMLKPNAVVSNPNNSEVSYKQPLNVDSGI